MLDLVRNITSMATADIPFTDLKIDFEPSNTHWLLRECGGYRAMFIALGTMAFTTALVLPWDMPSKLVPLRHVLQAATLRDCINS